MNTKTISERAIDIIEQYKDVPYFNNKTTARRAGLRVEVGKGSPKEIFDEVKDLAVLNKIDYKNLSGESLKKFMVENNVGIDCSGFAYYILNEESLSRDRGGLDRHLHFVNNKNFLSNFLAKLNPQKNIDVKTFAHDKNSKIVPIKDIQVGDMVTMIDERNHILVIYQIEYQNFLPVTLHYVHAVAWPTDGEYGHGIHKGIIEITDLNKSIVEQRWIELEKTGDENYTFTRARKSKTEVRRLKWFD